MSELFGTSPSRRGFLSISAAAVGTAAVGSALPIGSATASASTAAVPQAARPGIRPFRIHEPRAKLVDLRRRIRATNFPEKEPVPDQSQGPQLATMKALADYWANHYDWRRCEARFNSFPNYMTEIDGMDIHFIHARSKHKNALPLVLSHGWPGSILEQMKLIEPLTNPTAHGGKASDAFHVVVPSMPGYGYSGKPTETGWGPDRVGRTWITLMKRLGYTKFVASGGDWGGLVVELMALEGAPELAGIHTNFAGVVPPEIDAALFSHDPVDTTGFSAEEKQVVDDLTFFYKHVYYALLLADRPQTMTGLADSPIGLAAWLLDHDAASLAMISRVFVDGAHEGLSREDVLDNITHYWLTESGVSSSRIYADNRAAFFARKGVTIPVAVSVFPDELFEAPRSWAEEAYPRLIHYNKLPKGGHFAAWEQPRLFVNELRTGLRSLR
jgi:pimeloyl-ACP methyl ester carboxylesterase